MDFTAGYGPETATFAAGVGDGAYRMAVSVYTGGDEADPSVLGGMASVAVYGVGVAAGAGSAARGVGRAGRDFDADTGWVHVRNFG